LKRFTAAVEARDEATLLALFAPDATWTADGGGRAPAAPRPIVGAGRIVKLVLGLARQIRGGTTLHLLTVNGEAGLCYRVDGRLQSVLSVETDGERILSVWAVVNPAKLGSDRPAH
jgi:RNA polymerase sigma-70 factor (ECF subfamily)